LKPNGIEKEYAWDGEDPIGRAKKRFKPACALRYL
jgi:hypothetical protein